MKIFKILLFILLCFSTNSCSAKKDTHLGESKLLISIEERDFNLDRVIEYNIFDNGLFQKTIMHDTSSPENLFKSEFKDLDLKTLEIIKSYESKLSKLDYENSFPWKEGLYERGSVYKISFIASKTLQYLVRKSPKDSSEIKFEKILYYYEGHKEGPVVFKDLISFIKDL